MLRAKSPNLYPNVIIGGTNKAGTTSLFRYLSDHPSVCPSSVKEVRHFTRHADPLATDKLQSYAELFNCESSQTIRLEASPDYLVGGEEVAASIHSLLPDAKLIFILREPVSRLVSSFRRRQSRADPRYAGLTLQNYVDTLVGYRQDGENGIFSKEINSVAYGSLLEAYVGQFSTSQVAVRFFDDLKRDTEGFVIDICQFLEIDASFYKDYEFAVENRTRNYRSKSLQRLAYTANMRLEGLFNRFPNLRRAARTLYNSANEANTVDSRIEGADTVELERALQPDLTELRKFMTARYPEAHLPDWLKGI